MKLIYPRINFTYNLKNKQLNSLVIESPSVMEQCIIDLYEDTNGKGDNFRLSDDEEELSIARTMALVMTPIDFNYIKREINKSFLSYVKREIDESDLSQRIVEKYAEIKELLEELYYLSDIPIEYDSMVTENDIFKHFDIHLKTPEGAFVEKVIEYCFVLRRLTEKKIIVLANCEAYIEPGDYKYLEKHIETEEIYILLVSNKQLGVKCKLNECIIDRDMCELY